jgi:glycosyltransferase involved in cell wall biosynthesis
MSIAEGMASGCIPIVHDSGGPREMTDKNLRFKTIEEAANKINYTITQWSTGESSEMASNATVFSSTHFSNKFTESFNKYIISRD